MPLILSWTAATVVPVEADVLRPDALGGRTAAEIARLPILVGNGTVELGELFRVEGDPADGHLIVEGDLRGVNGLGRGMTGGRLEIRGDAGHRVGAEMGGGSIEVHGSVGERAGIAMRGGLLRIRGSAGDLLGAALPGARIGMREGLILVDGPVGDDAGLAMRRGTIAIAGSAGTGLGRGMIAGSILAFGPVGLHAGAGMKRGTLALFGRLRTELWPSFRFACRIRPPFVTLYLRQLRANAFPVPDATFSGIFERHSGDRLEGGKGEVLIWDGG